MGTTALQAAAASRPAVITYLDTEEPVTPGYLPDQRGNEFGERTAGGTEQPLETLVRALLDQESLRTDVAKRGYQLVREHYGMDAIMQRWLAMVSNASAKPMVVPPPLWFQPTKEGKLILRRLLYRNPEVYELQQRMRIRLRAAVGLAPFRARPRDD
jgi:hypothetical protein